MNKPIPAIIGWSLLFLALGIYIYGICWGIFMYDPGKEIEPLSSIVATINAILLTNLGAVLGIAVTKPDSPLAQRVLIGGNTRDSSEPTTKRESIQYFAVMLYILVLVTCFIAWICTLLEEKKNSISELIVQNGKALIGVITAYLGFVLGTAKTPEPKPDNPNPQP